MSQAIKGLFLSALLLVSFSICAETIVNPNTVISAGQIVHSENARYRLAMQTDGNLVLYRNDDAVRWSTATSQGGSFSIMQGDGNFVLYNPNGYPLWHTVTGGNPGAILAVQNDGNLVVYSSAGKALWAIGADPSPYDPKYAGDVVGRDLAYPWASSLGHIGIWDGVRVMEVGPGGSNAVKRTYLNDFRTASKYWGAVSPMIPNTYSVYDCYETDCTNWRSLKPYGQSEKVLPRMAIAKAAYQSYLIGADYTIQASYGYAYPREGAWPPVRGLFRCDTFVVAMYLKTVANDNSYWGAPIDATWQRKMADLDSTPRYPKNIFEKLRTFQ